MIRFLLEKFRQAPGPLKQPRLIVADLAEEMYDLASTYVESKRHGADYEAADDVPLRPATDPPASPAEPEEKPAAKAKAAPEKSADEPTLELEERLAKAVAVPGNKRKQEFKVLAILWDAAYREMPPMSAKAVSNHGVKMGLSIRHENVRKVIRMRLEKYIKVHAEGVGSGTIYRYELDDSGAEYFTTTYFD